MKKLFLLVTAITVLFTGFSVYGYEEIEVKDGGSVKGRVRITGNIPKDEVVKVTKDKSHCGETLPREKYVISPDGGVKNVVVFIENITRGKAIPKTEVVIDNKHCAFQPHVQVATRGQTLVIKNNDPMLHNTHIYLNRKTVYNFALPKTGMEIKKPINKTGIMEVECDAHDWMKGYLYVTEHPYITVTDEKGYFSIKDIPPGDYKLVFWHEALGQEVRDIKITTGSVVELNIEFKK